MNLYVIRHGLTDCNVEHIYNGRYDEDINEIGIAQAKEASKKVEKLKLDLIICSPLKRTNHTAELVNVNKVPIIYDDRILEREVGKLTLKSSKTKFHDTEFYNYYSTEYVEGLETLPELFKRVHSFLDEIKEKYKGKNILLVTHGGVTRAIQFYFEKMPEDGMIKDISGQKNCEIKEYKINNEGT